MEYRAAMIRRAALLSSTCGLLLACQDPGDGGDTDLTPTTTTGSSSGTGASETTDGTPTSGEPTTSTSSTGTTTTSEATTSEATTDATTEPSTTEGVETTTGDTSSGETTTTSDTSTTGETDSESGTTGEPSPYVGEPLPDAPVGEWQWVPFPEALCRDGSSTGIAVRYGSGPGLVLYFQGGGACFNAPTCSQNPDSFGAGSFANLAQNAGTHGIFDKDNPSNPVGDWNVVFVPYCTGDVHAGQKPDGQVLGEAQPQQFVGYTNVGHYLQRVVPTFLDSVDHVLVTGESAGGFGSAFNYDRLAEAFPGRAVTLIDDSGPVMADEVMAPCLQQQWRDLWNLDAAIPADCADCFPADGGGLSNLVRHLGEKHADQRLGLISSLQDQTIRYFFGFGLNNCTGGQLSGAQFTAGLEDLRDAVMNEPAGTWGTFYLSGSQHTWLTQSFYSAQAGGVTMSAWIADMLAGTAAHVAP